MYAADVHSSTMRAEMTGLRSLIGDQVVQSRPYRLVVDAQCDWKDVAAHVAAGRVREALQAYRGPLLPQSESPGVVSRRESVQSQLRAAVLASGRPDPASYTHLDVYKRQQADRRRDPGRDCPQQARAIHPQQYRLRQTPDHD